MTSNTNHTQNESKNPLSLKLLRVLGAHYEDTSTREALEILSTLYGSAPSTNPSLEMTNKVKRGGGQKRTNGAAAADSEESEDEPTVFLPLSAAALELDRVQSASRARKNLRKDVESKLAASSRMFLAAFSDVNQNLDFLQTQVEAMQVQCETANERLQTTNAACKHILERVDGLRVKRQTISQEQSVIASFLSKFTLTEEEVEAIESRDVPVGRRVFQAIDRCERIREDCQSLSSDTGVSRDIMNVTTSKLDLGYEKIFRWTQDEFRQLARDAHAEPSETLREAVKRLRRRPALFSEALGGLSAIRQTTLLSSFLAALTKGGPGGFPRPIELHAHEPTRYVGDMLAWVHQATAGEREFLETLFETQEDGRMVGSVRTFGKEKVTDEEMNIRELLDSDLEKLCTPLRGRVIQTVRSQEGSITAYKITNLLQFYLTTMKRTIGEEAILTQTLNQITDLAYKVFFETLQAHGRSLLRFLHAPDPDLAAPLLLRESSLILREIMQVYESSLLEDETLEQRISGFKDVLDASISPMLEMCTNMSAMIKSERGEKGVNWNRAVFLVNCLVYLESVVQPYSFTGDKAQELESQMDESVKVLVSEHYDTMLKESGLASILTAVEEQEKDTPLSRLPNLSSQHIAASLQAFDTFLSYLDVSTSQHLSLLSMPRLATLIHRAALERIANAYDRICEAIRDPRNKYEFTATLLGSRRPFGQLSVLNQVLGIETEQ